MSSAAWRIARVYEPPIAADGARVLVDRLWPRGLSKQAAALDLWLKDIAPSSALRTWFGHQPARFAEFSTRYRAELANNPAPIATLQQLRAQQPVVLLYAARDPQINHARVLADFLTEFPTASSPFDPADNANS